MTIVVSIGRRVQGSGILLSDSNWTEFKGRVSFAIAAAGFNPVFAGEGEGADTASGFDSEPSYTIIAVPADHADVRVDKLRYRLARLALAFQQQEIALMTGSTEFVKAAG
jgi:hypothetical protein